MKKVQNKSASVRQRLLNSSKAKNRPFSELLQYYSMERFLYRLSLSNHAQRYILKRALMLRVWGSPVYRPTMDIDMLGRANNNETIVISHIRDILAVDVEPDGLVFDPETIQVNRITEDADYQGIRVRFYGYLGTARTNMQIYIGFGDIIYPESEKAVFPCVLDFPAPLIHCYSRESAIAEKFEAMIKLGHLNSRMKDFYDIWLLARQFQFDHSQLTKAVRLTFKQRGTEINQPIEAFSTEFISSRQRMWTAFRKRLGQEYIPESFQEIAKAIELFLIPVIEGITGS